MRVPAKPQLAVGIRTVSGYKPTKLGTREYSTKGEVVIDGGGILHCVNWELKTKFTTIFQLFANFIQNNISTPDHVTTMKFDLYPDK